MTRGIGMSFTIAVKFSREWCLEPFFRAFNKLKFDRKDCNLILINNTDNKYITYAFSSGLKTPFIKNPEEFLSYQIIQTNNPHFERYDVRNFHNVPAPFHAWSAYYSFGMHELIAKNTKDNIHIQLEDDTIPPPETINSLVRILEENKDCVMSAVACPQREKGMATVGHNAYDEVILDEGFLVRRKNTPVYREGIKEIVATGYHAVAFRKDPFLDAIRYIKDLGVRIIGSGSDVYFTHYLSQMKGKILCDFSLWCDHLHFKDGKIEAYTVDNCKPWLHVWNPKRNKYDYNFI